MKNLTELKDNLHFRYHRHRIEQLRRKAAILIDSGTDCTSSELVELSNQILNHGMSLSSIWNRQKQRAPRSVPLDEAESDDITV